MFDQVEAHLTGPAHAAFHEPEIEPWVASHETTQENAPREGVVRFGEVADVVVGEVADGGAIRPADAACVLGHGHAEVDAPLPQRLVVIGAVEGDGIAVPGGLLRIDSLRRARDRPLLVSPQHDRFESQPPDRVFQLLDSFVRRTRGQDSYRRKPCGKRREHVSRHHVVGTSRGPLQIILDYAVDGEAEARIDQREVDAQFGQALVQQGRQQ